MFWWYFIYFLFDRPQNVPRLYDLVRVKDDQIRTAFYFALKNTLVANDLKQATDIAYQVKPLNVAVFLWLANPRKWKTLFLLFLITIMLSSMFCKCNGNHWRKENNRNLVRVFLFGAKSCSTIILSIMAQKKVPSNRSWKVDFSSGQDKVTFDTRLLAWATSNWIIKRSKHATAHGFF